MHFASVCCSRLRSVSALEFRIDSVQVCHVRVILMAHRLKHEEKAPISDRNIDDMIKCQNGASAFVKLVVLIQTWEPLLADIIMMTAWSNRGLREMELLALIGSLNQAKMRRFKEVPLFLSVHNCRTYPYVRSADAMPHRGYVSARQMTPCEMSKANAMWKLTRLCWTSSLCPSSGSTTS